MSSFKSSAKFWFLCIFIASQAGATETPALAESVAQTVLTVAPNGHNMCAIKFSGQLFCWGTQYTQAGGSEIVVPGDLGAVASADTNSSNTCAVLVSGQLNCWGSQFGRSGGSAIVVPSDLGAVKSVQTNPSNTCVVLVSRHVRCWGTSGYPDYFPTQVPSDLGEVTSLQTNELNACAIQISGILRCWGLQEYGVQENGSNKFRYQAIAVPSDLGVVKSVQTNRFNFCAISLSGKLGCWGHQVDAETNWAWPTISVPEDIGAVTEVSTNSENTCAVLVSGQLRCWGHQQHEGHHPAIVVPSDLGLVKSVDSDYTQTCALSVSGRVHCWGSVYGNTGWGTINVPSDLGEVASVKTNELNTCAILVSDEVRCWGYTQAAWGRKRVIVPGELDSTYGAELAPLAPKIRSYNAWAETATLTIDAPQDFGDSPISSYEYSADNGVTWSPFVSPTGSFIIYGLVNGKTYQVKVRARNTAGAGVESEVRRITPKFVVPAKPVIKSVIGLNGSARVTISEPTDFTASSIIGYRYSIDGGATYNSADVLDGAFMITGLTNGISTTLTVRAVNLKGSSLDSTAKTVIPATSPSAPVISTITPSAGALSISFTAPNTGGSAITGYQYSVDGGANWVTPKIAIRTSPLKVTGLTNGTNYLVKIRAVNGKGVGEASEGSVGSTPVLVPTAPKITSIARTNTSFMVYVDAPLSNGGAVITNYAYSIDSGTTWTLVNPASNSTSILITGLKPSTTYPVQIAAVNTAGKGAASASYRAATLR